MELVQAELARRRKAPGAQVSEYPPLKVFKEPQQTLRQRISLYHAERRIIRARHAREGRCRYLQCKGQKCAFYLLERK